MELLLLAVVVGAAALAVALWLRRRRDREWRRLARRLGLDVSRHRLHGAPILTGRFRGRRVRVHASDESSDTGLETVADAEIAVRLATAPPSGLRIRYQAAGESVEPSIVTGDEEFDEEAWVGADDPGEAQAWLVERRRRALRRLLELDAGLLGGVRGRWVWVRDGHATGDRERLEARLRQLDAIAAALEGDDGLTGLTAGNGPPAP